MKLPDQIRKLTSILAELPSIGPRQAQRLVFYLISLGPNSIHMFAEGIESLRSIKVCERCFFIHVNPEMLCDICSSKTRRQDIIMIVEKETDFMSIENTGKYVGRYLVLGPLMKTGLLDDVQKLRIESLKSFVQKELGGQAEEIILGLNPTGVGDMNASILGRELALLAKKISRLGRGLPTGGDIEFADDSTLGNALEGR